MLETVVLVIAMVETYLHFHFYLDAKVCWQYLSGKTLCTHLGRSPLFSVVKRVKNARQV